MNGIKHINMDYEKAYKAVLQTATQWIKDGCIDKEKICLECVFSELRESEDERIRESIVATIKQCPYDFLHPKNRDKMLAYLERMKKQKPVEIHIDNPNIHKVDHDVKISTSDSSAGGDELLYVSNKSYNIGYRDGKAEAQKPAGWKPSKKQIGALENARYMMSQSEDYYDTVQILDSLISDLKSYSYEIH